ncbi:MAG: ABC transporter [Bacillota bacterium]|nr:MAG: ABC transporter [Bacillota bacterium]
MISELFWVSFRHYLRRVSRDPFGLLIFVVLPVALVYVLSLVYTQNATEQIYVEGYNMASTYIAIGMMLMFQLNGGIYLLNFLNYDLMKPMKWRLKASPCPTYTLVFAGITACLIFTVLQGLVVVACTALFLDAYWGNLWIAAVVIVLISLISQMLNMILFLYIRNLNTAEYISWFLSWSMAVLGGLMFALPNNSFFNFMKQYGTPFSLAQSAIRESGFLGASVINMWICLAALMGITAILAVTVVKLGRARLT